VNWAVNAWERFWFAPTPTSTLALVRIAYGLTMVAWTLSLAPDLEAFYGRSGLLPGAPTFSGISWGVFQVADPDWLLWVVWAAMLVGALSVLVGLRPRLGALLIVIGIVSFDRRNPFLFNGGDGLVRIIALYLILAPSGEALSLDRRLRRDQPFWEFPRRAPWALRLMQIQLSIIYLSSVWEKLQGSAWPRGNALSYALRLDDLQRFPVPHLLSDVPAIVALLTWGTLLVEFGCGTLIWVRRVRPWVIVVGVLFHVGIAYSLRVGFFSAGMIVLYLTFVSPERAAIVIRAARDRLPGLLGGKNLPRHSRPVV
jgi:hypothetical protein